MSAGPALAPQRLSRLAVIRAYAWPGTAGDGCGRGMRSLVRRALGAHPAAQHRRMVDKLARGDTDVALPEVSGDGIGSILRAMSLLQQARRDREALAAENARQWRIRADTIALFPIAYALFDSQDRLLIRNPMFATLHPGLEDKIKPGITFQQLLRGAIELGL